MNALSSGIDHVLSKGAIEPLLLELRRSANILDTCPQLSHNKKGSIAMIGNDIENLKTALIPSFIGKSFNRCTYTLLGKYGLP